MWSVVKSCRFHHPITCQSCLHFSLSTSIPQTLSSLHFSWSPDNRRTSPLVHIHPLHPQDPAIFSRGNSDLVTAAAQFSVQSPYVGFHCSVVKVHNSHGGLQQHLPFWPHPYATVPLCSVTQSCLTLCNPMNCSTPGLPVHHQLPESTQTHVHYVGDAIQASHPLSSPSPALNLSQHQGLFKWVSSPHQVAIVEDKTNSLHKHQSLFRCLMYLFQVLCNLVEYSFPHCISKECYV